MSCTSRSPRGGCVCTRPPRAGGGLYLSRILPMIAIETTTRRLSVSQQTAQDFEAMLPTIRRVASYRFRRAPPWRREELIQDVIAKAYLAYVNLVARGKSALAFPTILADFAVRHV